MSLEKMKFDPWQVAGAAVVGAFVSAIFGAASLGEKVDNLTRRVDVLAVKADAATTTQATMQADVAAIRTELKYLGRDERRLTNR
jgi:hypothetical protein